MSQRVLTKEELFCLEGCRSYDQYYRMRKDIERLYCPFCDIDRTKNKVLYEDDHWLLWENIFPRETLSVQLVIACKYHVRFLEELPVEA